MITIGSIRGCLKDFRTLNASRTGITKMTIRNKRSCSIREQRHQESRGDEEQRDSQPEDLEEEDHRW